MDEEADRDTATPPFVELPSGESLNEVQAAEITRQGPTRVVIVAGPPDSGKTTMLTSLFEAFLEAPFGNFLFAGSRTLVGFERRCHDSRMASGRETAHTSHTSVNSVDFLHLRLMPPGSALGAQNLLLSDIAGEHFERLQDYSQAVKEMAVLRRADHFCLVLDCQKLVDASLRHVARNQARSLLRSILEAEALSPSCKIELVFAKWDLVLSAEDSEGVKAFVANTRATLEQLLRSVVALPSFEVAARPNTTKVPFAFGMPTLLRYWLEEPVPPSRPEVFVPRDTDGLREPARFASAVFRGDLAGEYDVRWV